MDRTKAAVLIALFLGVASPLSAASNNSTVVTNPTPAVSASMQLFTDAQGCFDWSVSGKVKPAYRGHGANVQLFCMKYALLGGDPGLVYPQCDGPCFSVVDACGNFTFDIHTCGTSPQLDNSYFCTFVVHVDDSHTPQACNNAPPSSDAPDDPNGTAPCAGGFCPDTP